MLKKDFYFRILERLSKVKKSFSGLLFRRFGFSKSGIYFIDLLLYC